MGATRNVILEGFLLQKFNIFAIGTHPIVAVNSYYSDLPTSPHGAPQVSPLTPSTNLKIVGMGEALRATYSYSSWKDQIRQRVIPRDPRLWESVEVVTWLDWAVSEFQLFSDDVATYNRDFRVSH